MGDDNIRYFYAFIKDKNLQQAIVQIKDNEGIVQTDPEALASIFVDFCKELLGRKEIYRIEAFNSFLKNGHIFTVAQ